MGKSLSPDKIRASIAIGAAVTATLIPSSLGQICAIVASGLFGWAFLHSSATLPQSSIQIKTGKLTGVALLSVFALLLVLLPVAAIGSGSQLVKLFDSFYRAGALVFGGGHVVLPLLQSQVVSSGWVSNDVFLAGYGAAQAVPGPLFTFAAYLGAVSTQPPSGVAGAGIALVAIFLPSFLLVIGIIPFWEQLRCYAVSSGQCLVLMPQSWGFCWQLFTILYGQAPSIVRLTSAWQPLLFCYWYFGKPLRGWLCC